MISDTPDTSDAAEPPHAYAAQAGLDIIQDYCDVGVSGGREGRPQLNALMTAARNREIDRVLVWKFNRFARSTRHLLAVLEEFNHLDVSFVSVQDQIDTDSPMGRAMFTVLGALAELESSLISEHVAAGMRAAETKGKHFWRPATTQRVISAIEALDTSTDFSIRQIQTKIGGRASRGIVGETTKRARSPAGRPVLLTLPIAAIRDDFPITGLDAAGWLDDSATNYLKRTAPRRHISAAHSFAILALVSPGAKKGVTQMNANKQE